jgi:hypothetical protein
LFRVARSKGRNALRFEVCAIDDRQDDNTTGKKKALCAPSGAGGLHGRVRLPSGAGGRQRESAISQAARSIKSNARRDVKSLPHLSERRGAAVDTRRPGLGTAGAGTAHRGDGPGSRRSEWRPSCWKPGRRRAGRLDILGQPEVGHPDGALPVQYSGSRA